jgi:hypothetical protein
MVLTDNCKLTDKCKVQGSSLVRIPQKTWDNESDKKSNGPAEIRTPDPRHVKAVS